MKFGVSKILPNSLSKWLSPKVDMSNARRRRHEEMDSEDEIPNRNELLLGAPVSSQYQTTPQLAAPPPNKKKKTFTVSFIFVMFFHSNFVFFFCFTKMCLLYTGVFKSKYN